MSIGIRATTLGPAYRHSVEDADSTIGVSFVIRCPTDTTNSTYTIFRSGAPKRFEVIYATGTMTGAGAAADTVVIQNNGTAITDTVDLSTLGDTAVFDFADINDAQYRINKGGTLQVVTASAALCIVYIHCMWVE